MELNTADSHQSTTGPPLCIRCNKHIYDGTISQVKGQFLHSGCIKCVVCRNTITGCCHMKGNELYCRPDFIRLFGAKCTCCNEIITPSDFVHVANSNLYHTTCFTCITCGCQLQPGNQFYMKDDGKLVCSTNCQSSLHEDSYDTDSGSDESGSDDTDTRDVTSFDDNQLRMLTETYQSNERPSRGLRKKMSTESGLSVRAIQIWFQNRRAKDRNQCKNGTINYFPNGRTTVSSRKNNSRKFNHSKTLDTSINGIHQFGQLTSHNISQTFENNYQLYCPLDFLVPNEMPPNVDLSSADICNGEVVARKRNANNFHALHQTTPFLPEGSFQWLTA